MIPDEIKRVILPHLGNSLSEAQAILFTGAGFSHPCENFAGDTILTGYQLRAPLWKLVFDGLDLGDSTLADIYANAEMMQPQKTTDLLTRLLSVDPQRIPEYYEALFSAPWKSYYTLNLDNLADAAATRFSLPRELISISATTSGVSTQSRVFRNALEVVHLNGTLPDLPHHVTFSPLEYGQRANDHDFWYSTLVSELLSMTAVFIGTKLDEGPFWQYIQLRRLRGS